MITTAGVEAAAADARLWFVYRNRKEGWSGKRVRRLPDPSVLAWFQRMWTLTADSLVLGEERHRWWADGQVAADLGGDVYLLSMPLCDPRRQRGTPNPPATWQQLRDWYHNSPWNVGFDVHVDQHSLRVATGAHHTYSSYYFFDDHLAAAHPDRVAYLLHDRWELPQEAATSGSFDPGMPLLPLGPVPGRSQGATYVIEPRADASLADGGCESCHCHALARPKVIAGVRLPGLADYLRTVIPQVTKVDTPLSCHRHHYCGWPEKLLALRALLAPGEARLPAALARYSRWESEACVCEPGELPPEQGWLLGHHEQAHPRALRRLGECQQRRQGARVRIRHAEHLIQMSEFRSEFGDPGFYQWVVFDDLWATAHPDLARSLLRYASTWDPIGPVSDWE